MRWLLWRVPKLWRMLKTWFAYNSARHGQFHARRQQDFSRKGMFVRLRRLTYRRKALEGPAMPLVDFLGHRKTSNMEASRGDWDFSGTGDENLRN